MNAKGGGHAQRRDVADKVARIGFSDRRGGQQEAEADQPRQQRTAAEAAPGHDQATQAAQHDSTQQWSRDDDVALIGPDPASVGLDYPRACASRIVFGEIAGSLRRSLPGRPDGEHELVQVQCPVTLRYVRRVNARWRQEIFPEIATYRPQIIQWLRPDRLQGKALAEAVGALAERPAWKAADRAAPDVVIRPLPLAHGHVQAQLPFGSRRLDLRAVRERGDPSIKEGAGAGGDLERAMRQVVPGGVSSHRGGECRARDENAGNGAPAGGFADKEDQKDDQQGDTLGPDQRCRGQQQPGQRTSPHRRGRPPQHH